MLNAGECSSPGNVTYYFAGGQGCWFRADDVLEWLHFLETLQCVMGMGPFDGCFIRKRCKSSSWVIQWFLSHPLSTIAQFPYLKGIWRFRDSRFPVWAWLECVLSALFTNCLCMPLALLVILIQIPIHTQMLISSWLITGARTPISVGPGTDSHPGINAHLCRRGNPSKNVHLCTDIYPCMDVHLCMNACPCIAAQIPMAVHL